MDSIVGNGVKASLERETVDYVCRFCMLPCEENEMLRIPWNDWKHSLLAAMYERIMNQEVRNFNVKHVSDAIKLNICYTLTSQLFISKDCSEFYCNKCSQLLSTSVDALDMFQRSDEFWRKTVKVAIPMIQPKNEYLECTEDDPVAEYLNDDIEMAGNEPKSSFAVEFVKTEFLNDVRSEIGEFVANQSDNVHKEMDMFAEVLNICKEDKGNVDKKRITKSSEGANHQLFECSQCDELFRNRKLLTRHMVKLHSLKLCVRCNFTTPDRLD